MLTIAENFARIITMLQAALGVFAARQTRAQNVTWLGTQAFYPVQNPNAPKPLPDATWTLFWYRIARLATRFQTLYTKWREHRLPKQRTRLTTPRPQRPPHPRLPTQTGWVNHRIPESAPPTGYLDALLHDPETKQFVEEAPQAGRLLRPLCHALGVPQPAWLKLPPRPRKPRPQKPTRPRPPSLTDPTLRLPRNVIAAARAWKKTSR